MGLIVSVIWRRGGWIWVCCGGGGDGGVGGGTVDAVYGEGGEGEGECCVYVLLPF